MGENSLKLDSGIKVLLAQAQREQLQVLARQRQLSEADEIRAAVRFYLKAQQHAVQAAMREAELEPA